MRYVQLVMGPAGAGKSSYCATMLRHLHNVKRSAHVFNLDPAAESFSYPVTWDIRDIISVDDVAQALDFGPNGGLIYCMEFLLQNLSVLDDALGSYEDDYLLFDCPGQIELYTHMNLMRQLVEHLKERDFRIVGVYLLDSQFIDDPAKFFSGILSCMAAMLQLEIPHINVLTKIDLLSPRARDDLEAYLDPDPDFLLGLLSERTTAKHHRLNRAMANLVRDFSLVRFFPLTQDDEDSVGDLLLQTDMCLQYGEDEEPKDPQDAIDEAEEAAAEAQPDYDGGFDD